MRNSMVIGVLLGMLILAGCSQQTETPETKGSGMEAAQPAVAPEEKVAGLMEDWKALEENARIALFTAAPENLAMEMHYAKPDGHLGIVEALEAPESSDDLIALAVGSLQALAQLDEDGNLLLDRVEKLADSDNPARRAGALQLLAVSGKPAYRGHFEASRDHADTRVRIAALGGLSRLGDTEATNELASIYFDESTRPLERDRAAFEIACSPDIVDMKPLEDAVVRHGITPGTRAVLIDAIGKHGNAWHIKLLQEFRDNNLLTEGEEEHIRAALEMLHQRGDQAVQDAIAGEEAATESPAEPSAPLTLSVTPVLSVEDAGGNASPDDPAGKASEGTKAAP